MKRKRKEKDYCKNCPMHWQECDYWGEWDEGCEAFISAFFDGKWSLICRMPVFIKKIYEKYIRYKTEKYWEKEISKYKEEPEREV